MNTNLTFLWGAILRNVSRHPRLKLAAQKFRYLLMRGPLQTLFVDYYRKRSKKSITFLSSLAIVSGESLFPPIDVVKAVAEIRRQSYSACLQLPPEIIEEILAFREKKDSHNIHHPHKNCRAIMDIAHDPQIIAVVREYFQTEPVFYGSRLYYAAPRISSEGEIKPKYKDAKMVHFDVSDYLEMNVFFYLSDVDLETSPHKVFAGTHHRKSFRDLFSGRYTEKEALKRFHADCVALTGNAGLGFFEDPNAFHIQSLGKKGRMTLSFNYTMQRKAELALPQDNL